MSKLIYDAETPLYTSDRRGWRLDEFDSLMDQTEAARRPIVVFVHGRGKEPNKSLNGGQFTVGMAVHKIEMSYGAKVIMFNWNSAFKGFAFLDREEPLSHTSEAALSFSKVLHGLAQRNSGARAVPPPSLLVHSMGSIVVQKVIQQDLWPTRHRMFSNVLLV